MQLSFPLITVEDMVNAQSRLVDHLGIDKSALRGGRDRWGACKSSSGWRPTPSRVRSAIPIATTLKHSPQQIAFDEVGRQAVMADPDWHEGDYYETGPAGAGARRGPDDRPHHLHE